MAEQQSIGKLVLDRFKELAEIRRDYEEGMWKDITRFCNPRREDIGQDTFKNKKGQRRGKDVYDGTPLGALNTWADGMQGHIISETLSWFKSAMGTSFLNEFDDVIEWLQLYDSAMYAAFGRSNLYSVLGEWFRDAGSVGTATIHAEEDIVGGINRNRTVYTCINPREAFIAEDKYGRVDTVFRKFTMTARNAYDKFGDECSQTIKDNKDKQPHKEHYFIHAVFPNTDRWPDKLNAKNKPFRSVYVEMEASDNQKKQIGNVVRDSGYDFNPYVVWRFRKNSDEIYGYSPAADALVEVFTLNQLGKDLLEASHRAVKPAWNIPSNMRGNVRIGPDGRNYYDDPKRIISPVQARIDYPFGIDQLERLKKSIEDKYRVYFFQFLLTAGEGRERTAEEIIAMKSQQAILLGPQVGRLIDEGLRQIFEVQAEIEDRAGNLPDPPAILYEQDSEIKINFIGPLAQAQKRLFKLQPIREGLNELAPAMALFPEMIWKIKAMDTADEILEAANFPEKLTRSNEEAEQRYQQALQKQQQAEAQQALMGATEGYKNVTKAPEAGSPAEVIAQQLL